MPVAFRPSATFPQHLNGHRGPRREHGNAIEYSFPQAGWWEANEDKSRCKAGRKHAEAGEPPVAGLQASELVAGETAAQPRGEKAEQARRRQCWWRWDR